jgi:hypothetical protein
MHNDIFICSSPVQMLNILNIVQSKKISSNNGYLFFLFNKNFNINEAAKNKIIDYYGKFFKNILFVKKQNEVFENINIGVSTLFTYSDVGLERIFIKQFNPSRVVIYEEGYATYHPTFAYSILLKIKYLIKGFATFIGNSSLTNEVIVHYPRVYSQVHKKGSSTSIAKFNSTFVQTLENNLHEFYDIFDFEAPSLSGVKNVLMVMLGDSDYNNQLSLKISKEVANYDLLIFKKHPLHDFNSLSIQFSNAMFIESNIPAEYIIYDCNSYNVSIDIYHESSTTAIYMKEHISKAVNMGSGEFQRHYDKIYRLF